MLSLKQGAPGRLVGKRIVFDGGAMPLDQPPVDSWITSNRPLPRLVVRPLREFLDTEAAGGIVLLAATAVALGWANSPWRDVYDALWSTDFSIRLGAFHFGQDLRHWVNDGLMAVFFFVVGLEIKREIVAGDLRYARSAALPIIGALGGMIVPALLYSILNSGGEGAAGWGIPMATDIAFALGVLALFGSAVPSALKVFLLTLAIVDDIGAILVIAVFYSSGIQIPWLLVAFVFFVATAVLRSIGVWWLPAYLVLGTGAWLATYQSGVHATIAGVALGLLTPAHAQAPPSLEETPTTEQNPQNPTTVQSISSRARASISVVERLEHALHPWTSYAIVPTFALANAGITLAGEDVAAAVESPITKGIVIGLVAGKLFGVLGSAWLAHRLGFAILPEEVSWFHIGAAAAVAGIGFTVSIFIASLAFSDARLIAEAKIGVLAASVLATLLGAGILRFLGGPQNRSTPAPPRDQTGNNTEAIAE
jgi:Na+:H+ antiporter, NhaA family